MLLMNGLETAALQRLGITEEDVSTVTIRRESSTGVEQECSTYPLVARIVRHDGSKECYAISQVGSTVDWPDNDPPKEAPKEQGTYIPAVLLERADLLAQEAEIVSKSGRNWRGRLRNLGDYGLSGGSAADRRSIVQFFAGLETRKIETGSLS